MYINIAPQFPVPGKLVVTLACIVFDPEQITPLGLDLYPYRVDDKGKVEGPLRVFIKNPFIPISLTVPNPQLAFLTVQLLLHIEPVPPPPPPPPEPVTHENMSE